MARNILQVCSLITLCLYGCETSTRTSGDAGDSTVMSDTVTPDQGRSQADQGIVGPNDCRWRRSASATAACIEPNRPPEYYVAEAEAHFDTLDLDADRESVPDYHPQVVRWEWPPWLLLTGYTADEMILPAMFSAAWTHPRYPYEIADSLTLSLCTLLRRI